MVAGMALLTLNNAFLKTLTLDYPPGQLITLRAAFVFIPIAILAWHAGGWSSLRINNYGGQSIRAGFLVITQFLMVTSIALLPLADVTALTFSGPLVITALAPAILGEHVGWRRWAAVMVGFIGVVIMMRPTPEAIQPLALVPIVAALFSTFRDIATRRISATESTNAIMVWSTLGLVIVGLLTITFGWVAVGWVDLSLLALAGIGRVLVIGTSLGGLLAMAMGAAMPTVLAGVVLNDVGPEIGGTGLARIIDYIGTDRPHPDWASAVATTVRGELLYISCGVVSAFAGVSWAMASPRPLF